MLKSALLWASTSPTLARTLPRYRFVRRAVRRFMPGETMEEALRAGEQLGGEGIPTIVTELGENVATREQAGEVVEAYRLLAVAVRERALDTELSVKLTHLGLDQGREVAMENLAAICRATERIVWVDMESSDYVDATLHVFRAVRERAENVGICLQAYLHRTEKDYASLLPLEPHVRLVKGAYLEPPEVAMPRKADVDEAYHQLAVRMLEDRKAGRLGRPGIATHDARLVEGISETARSLGLGAGEWEVEMLYGIGVPLQRRLLAAGVPLRVLISYGRHWFPWYMRRLAERPANVGFVLRQLVSR